jgi:hypothetical protein
MTKKTNFARIILSSLLILGLSGGAVKADNQDIEKKVTEYKEFIKQNPDSIDANYYLGIAYTMQGK